MVGSHMRVELGMHVREQHASLPWQTEMLASNIYIVAMSPVAALEAMQN